ncbi:MAG TPA: hypothetical protein VEK84_16380 [Terriglobales bacterium]|nr:hypothetical protein [Terriglobales bacterium]
MKPDRLPRELRALQWVLGLVIVAESAAFLFSSGAAHAFAKTGLPGFIRTGLGGMELAAAMLVLIPRMAVAGGWLLVALLSVAILLHLVHGWFDVGGLVVYLFATWAVIRSMQSSELRNETHG